MTPEERARLEELRAKRDGRTAPQSALSPEDRARLAELRAKRDGAIPAASTPDPNRFPAQQGLEGPTVRQPEAWEAGALDYLANMPEREQAGIKGGVDAALFNVANTLTAGGLQKAGNEVVPGKDLGDAAMRESENYHPMASLVGRAGAYVVPASQGGRVANMAIQDVVTATGARSLAPKAIREGTSAGARSARYLGRLGTLAPTGALQVGTYEGLVEQPVRDFMAGEESTIGGRVQAGVNALKNPTNYGVLPVLSVAGRLGKGLVTGVATGGDVQRAVTRGSGGAVPLSEGQLAADAAQILDTQAMGAIDPRGFKLVERILRQSGVSDSDVPAVNAKVREILETTPDAVASRLTIGQVYAKALYDLDKTQASENILKVLRERRNVTDVNDRSPAIVGNEVRDLRSSQVDFITQSAESNLGAGKRIDIKNAVADTKKQIGAEYERVLAEANTARPEAPELSALVIGDSSKGALVRRAKNAGFKTPDGKGDVDAYAMARPDEAAHWLRSHLDKAARSAQGRERVDLQNTVDQLDELLDTNPGYAAARRQYGTEGGVDRARDIGSNFITAARNQGNLDLLLEQIAALPARERDVALLAIRDNLLSPVRGSGEDAPARISQLISVGTLEGIERLGPAGKGLADDLRAIRDENGFLNQIDSGNPTRQSATFSNADAAQNAPDLYSGGIARTLNAGGGSSLPADIAISGIAGGPLAPFTMAKIARSGLQSIFAPGRKSKEAMTQFLMSRPRNALSGTQGPAPGADDIMPSAGIAPGAERAQEALQQPPNALAPPPSRMSPERAEKKAMASQSLGDLGRRPTDAEIEKAPWLDWRKDDTERFELEIRHLAEEAGKGADGEKLLERIYADAQAAALQAGQRLDDNLFAWDFAQRMREVVERMREGDLSDLRAIGDIKSNGLPLRGDLGNQAIAAGVGSVGGSANDLNDDGKKDWQDAALGALGGLGVVNAPRAVNALRGRTVGAQGDDVARTAGVGGGRKPPKPDSPEAIKAAVKDIAKPKKEPTRLEQMVEEGKDAAVPPVNTLPREADALGAQAERMSARGLGSIEIYDQTGVAMIPYNGGQVPVVSPAMGPEELTRVFYGWLKEPPAKRPEWVRDIIARAPRKKGLMLTDANKIDAPAQPNALAETPLPKAGFPGGAVALGAGAGAVTGIPAGILAGTMIAREQDRKRNALAE